MSNRVIAYLESPEDQFCHVAEVDNYYLLYDGRDYYIGVPTLTKGVPTSSVQFVNGSWTTKPTIERFAKLRSGYVRLPVVKVVSEHVRLGVYPRELFFSEDKEP